MKAMLSLQVMDFDHSQGLGVALYENRVNAPAFRQAIVHRPDEDDLHYLAKQLHALADWIERKAAGDAIVPTEGQGSGVAP